MKQNDDMRRVVIAITETSPVADLWQAAMGILRESRGDLLALFVDDDRWRRAASLPFTTEISRLGGGVADFTLQRAEELNREAVLRMQQRLQRLAAEAEKSLAFEVLPESDLKRIENLFGSGANVLVAPSFITNRPFYAQIQRLDCQVLLIEATEEQSERG